VALWSGNGSQQCETPFGPQRTTLISHDASEISHCMHGGLCGARGHCRISPPCFLAECRKRRLNRGSFVSAVCLVVCFL